MNEQFDFDLVCIGSGPAGQRAAVQAAKLRKRVAVVERRRICGGVCIDTGTIPSKTFREAVLLYCGPGGRFDRRRRTRPESRPTAELLMSQVENVVRTEAEVIESQLRRNDVTLLWGNAAFRGPHTLVVDGDDGQREVTSDKILIAVGTRPLPPPGVAEDGEVVLTSDAVTQLKRIPKSLAVVGAGVIGIEYASMFATLGVEVTLIEKRARPLEFLDAEIVDELIHQMRNRNVTFRMGEAVDSVSISEGPPRTAVIQLESGKRIVSDMVLFSAGRVGATDTLALETAGLKHDDRGRIAVDASFRTNVPHVFAAGDVIGYPSLAATSSEQGRLAACHAFGVEAGPMAAHFPIGIYAIPEISTVGAPEHELTANKVPYETGVARYREIARGQILGDDSGMLKMVFDRRDRRLLGVHAIGTGATELIHIGQAVLALGGGLDYILQTVFNYPTLAECYKVAALDASNKLRR
ncbi:MAG TPA: Si-specific NAD(P)(+) transhydrogenase [Candidatus Polarisedimenticolaceae bacterium]|nr:Si-specific NAD(P)(+) transhydrogenase [Candidatus Polarisedimenticolaceae bacterium]